MIKLLKDYVEILEKNKEDIFLIKAKNIDNAKGVSIFEIVRNKQLARYFFVQGTMNFNYQINYTYVLKFYLKNSDVLVPIIIDIVYNVTNKKWLI